MGEGPREGTRRARLGGPWRPHYSAVPGRVAVRTGPGPQNLGRGAHGRRLPQETTSPSPQGSAGSSLARPSSARGQIAFPSLVPIKFASSFWPCVSSFLKDL